jgi:lysophospholipase L1-like esterase
LDRPDVQTGSSARFKTWAAASGILAAAAFTLLVIHAEFQVAPLDAFEPWLDALFLAGLAGLAIALSAERWGPGTPLRIGVVLVAIAVPLLAAEFVTRYIFRDVRSSADGRTYFARRSGPPIAINRLGFREREIGSKQPGRYRIAVVGDSLTWGQGLDVSERFSDVLERSLGSRYEVLNFGIPGDNLPEHLHVLERALAVAPDFVLLQLYINDFETPDMKRPSPHALLPWPALDRRLLPSSALYDMVNDTWAQLQGSTGIVESYVHYMDRNLKDANSPNSRLAFGMLRQFVERTRSAGAASGMVLFPNPGLFGEQYPFAYLHDRVREVCADQGITCLDLRGAFSTFKSPQDMWVSRFDQHPNARANKRAAQEILTTFGGLWQPAR